MTVNRSKSKPTLPQDTKLQYHHSDQVDVLGNIASPSGKTGHERGGIVGATGKDLHRSLVVATWDGKGDGPPCYREDDVRDYDLLVIDFMGGDNAPGLPTCEFLSVRCESKCQIFSAVHAYLTETGKTFSFVGLLDDDIEITSGQINELLRLAVVHELDGFAPALSRDSYYSWEETRVRPRCEWHPVEVLELMMPFYAFDLFMAGGEFYRESISGYGLDRFVMMLLQKVLLRDKLGVIDAVVVRHMRAVTSHMRTFSNGRNPWQERVFIRDLAMRHVKQHHPELIGTVWYMRCYADPGGPLRFWGPWLAWPALYLRGALARLRQPNRQDSGIPCES